MQSLTSGDCCWGTKTQEKCLSVSPTREKIQSFSGMKSPVRRAKWKTGPCIHMALSSRNLPNSEATSRKIFCKVVSSFYSLLLLRDENESAGPSREKDPGYHRRLSDKRARWLHSGIWHLTSGSSQIYQTLQPLFQLVHTAIEMNGPTPTA